MPTIAKGSVKGLLWDGSAWISAPGNTDGQFVQGNVASGATDAGHPVKVGGRHNTTLPTLTNGQRGDFQLGSRGSLAVSLFHPGSTNTPGFSASMADATGNAQTGFNAVAFLHGFNGTNWDRLRSDTTNGLDVDVTRIATPTSGGYSIHRSLDLDETEEEVKATAGQVFGWHIYNDGAAEVYVKFYNATAATVVVGTTTPVMTVPIPAGAAANVEFFRGIVFATAITVAATTGVADADVAAPAANQCVANIFWA